MRRDKAGRQAAGFTSALLLMLILIGACSGMGSLSGEEDVATPTPLPGSSARGEQLILNYGCGGCHTIPGIVGANSHVGPPLTGWSERRYIAGSLLNAAENLILWIQNPKEIEPNTAMPDIGVTAADAQDIAAYLYTLR
jgi:cytochrome c2